jgi:hypothetical protein
VHGSSRTSALLGLLLSAILAFSSWMASGLVLKYEIAPHSKAECTCPDERGHGRPARIESTAEMRVDQEDKSDEFDAVALVVARDTSFALASVGLSWRADLRSVVSPCSSEGHGARGPPFA